MGNALTCGFSHGVILAPQRIHLFLMSYHDQESLAIIRCSQRFWRGICRPSRGPSGVLGLRPSFLLRTTMRHCG